MDVPSFNGEPGALPSDPEWDARREPEPEPLACRDCGSVIEEGAHGTFTGIFCDACWRFRAKFGLEFDPRTKAQIEVERRKGAA